MGMNRYYGGRQFAQRRDYGGEQISHHRDLLLRDEVNTGSLQKVCKECGDEFLFTEGEVDYYAMHDLIQPKRCQPCRKGRKLPQPAETPPPPSRQTPRREEIICDHCGRAAEVPFKPFENRSVYCKVCWIGIKNIGAPIIYPS